MRSIVSHIKQFRPGVFKLLALIFWIAIWQIAAWATDSVLILPGPVQTILGIGEIVQEGAFFSTIAITLLRVFLGVLIAGTCGIIAGFLCGLNTGLYTLLKPVVTVSRTLPVVSVSILLNLWIQSDWVPLAVTFLVCFPIAFTNIVEGVGNVNQKLLEMATLYQVPKMRVLKDIYVPSLKPYGAAALMNAIGMGWKATVTAEVLANALPSMGMNLYYAKIYLETERLFSWTLVVVVLSYGIEKLAVYLLRKVRAGEEYAN